MIYCHDNRELVLLEKDVDYEGVGEGGDQCKDGEHHTVQRSREVRGTKRLRWVDHPTRPMGNTTELCHSI